jgi:hypothetical protein
MKIIVTLLGITNMDLNIKEAPAHFQWNYSPLLPEPWMITNTYWSRLDLSFAFDKVDWDWQII